MVLSDTYNHTWCNDVVCHHMFLICEPLSLPFYHIDSHLKNRVERYVKYIHKVKSM